MELVTHFAQPNEGADALGPFHPICGAVHQVNEGLSPKKENVTCEGCIKALAAVEPESPPTP